MFNFYTYEKQLKQQEGDLQKKEKEEKESSLKKSK